MADRAPAPSPRAGMTARTGLSWWSFHFLTILTTGSQRSGKAALAAVAFSRWTSGFVVIQRCWRGRGRRKLAVNPSAG
jgi:hypothetical protein